MYSLVLAHFLHTNKEVVIPHLSSTLITKTITTTQRSLPSLTYFHHIKPANYVQKWIMTSTASRRRMAPGAQALECTKKKKRKEKESAEYRPNMSKQRYDDAESCVTMRIADKTLSGAR